MLKGGGGRRFWQKPNLRGLWVRGRHNEEEHDGDDWSKPRLLRANHGEEKKIFVFMIFFFRRLKLLKVDMISRLRGWRKTTLSTMRRSLRSVRPNLRPQKICIRTGSMWLNLKQCYFIFWNAICMFFFAFSRWFSSKFISERSTLRHLQIKRNIHLRNIKF